MKAKLLVTIDAEENWEGPGSDKEPDVSNVYKLPDLQRNVFDKFNIRPVYLITYPVARDQRCMSLLGEICQSGKCEIGTHLHNWNSPPFTEQDVIEKSYHFRLPYTLEKQKIADLTCMIQDNFKARPVTFRAGRWGADGETIKILAELDYKTDVSVVPLIDYTDAGGMDFYNAPFEPYYPSFDNINVPSKGDNNKVLEIPVTYGFSQLDFERMRGLYKKLTGRSLKNLHLIGILYRTNILRRIKLSPETANFKDMKKLVDLCLARKHRILHLTFHSSMNSTGKSPFSMTKNERDARLRDLDDILDYIVNAKKVESATVGDIYDGWQRT